MIEWRHIAGVTVFCAFLAGLFIWIGIEMGKVPWPMVGFAFAGPVWMVCAKFMFRL